MNKRRPKYQRLTISFFKGLMQAGYCSMFISFGCFVINQWVDIKTTQTAQGAEIKNNKEAITHNYTEMLNYLSDIRETVHAIKNDNDRRNQ